MKEEKTQVGKKGKRREDERNTKEMRRRKCKKREKIEDIR
jgi:hypothetical protein